MDTNKNNRSLLSRWKSKSNKETAVASITKAPLDIDIPLSWGQQRLWFLQQLYPNNPFYNYCETYVFKGSINVDIFEQSIQEVFNNNSIFRSTYHVNSGESYQVVNDKKIPITRIDLSQFGSTEKNLKKEELLKSEANKSFNLSVFPLVNTSIIKLSNEELVLNLNMHHIITDKWSMGIFRKELSKVYKSLVSGESLKVQKDLQYSDYAYWQFNQEIDTGQLNFWKEKLVGEIPKLDLPFDFPRKSNSSFKGAFDRLTLDVDLSRRVLDLSRQFETTPYVLLLSVFNLFIFKYTRQNDILIGSPISNRSEKALEQLIGFFNETVILRTTLSMKMTFRDLVEQLKSNTLEAFSNKDVPFDLLVKELKPSRSLSVNPFFQVMFLYHAVPDTLDFGEGIELEYFVQDLGIAKFDLTLYVAEENGKLSTTFEYATDLFREATIKRFQKHFEILLENIVKDPNLPLGEIKMLTENEKTFINSNNAFSNAEYAGIHELFTSQVEKHPQHIAAIFGEEYISYLELDKNSTQMAINLQKYTGGQNKFIGLCVERSIDMIVAIMGVLKAGCAYMPIDPDYPEQRIDFILNDANVEILLTNERLHSHLQYRAKFVATIGSLCVVTKESYIDLPEPDENNYAYLIYTSGSSGQPKGVAITHRNIVNSTLGRTHFYKENPSSFLLMSSISFDSSKVGIFWTLCTGGKLVISKKRLEQDIEALIKTLQHNKVSHTLMLPTLYKLLMENSIGIALPDLKTIIVAGEACNPSVAKLHFSQFPSKALYNEYGPTEATVWCIAHKINEDDVDSIIPIGKPVANAIIYLLDDSLNRVPFGASGEIYVGGPGVANGYLNRDDLTQRVFVKNPFDHQKTKLYKTGDLARYSHDGSLEFLGRVDKQIKIRGYRIELQEIEKIMLNSKMMDEVVLNIESTSSPFNKGIKYPSHDEVISLLTNHLNEDEINELIHSVENIHPEERSYLIELLDK